LRRYFLSVSCFLFVSSCSNPSNNSGLSPDSACDRYLRCLQTSDPSAFGNALNTYGTGSACWQSTQQAAQTCSQACTQARQSLSCGCLDDSDCMLGARRCDTTQHVCVECLSDSDCASSFQGPFCLASKHSCIACRSNDDCPGKNCSLSAQNTPFCGSCANVTDGCTSPCDVFYNCTLAQVLKTGAAWSSCLGDDSCCTQTQCGEYAPLRACLLQNCGTQTPNPMFTQELADLTLCAETMCADTLLACHQNAC
jgi:hypothetical protein